ELAKFALVLYLARSLAKRGERVRELWHGVIPHCLVVGLIALLCLREPDFGTAALSGVILVLMLFAAGGRLAHPPPFPAAAAPRPVRRRGRPGSRRARRDGAVSLPAAELLPRLHARCTRGRVPALPGPHRLRLGRGLRRGPRTGPAEDVLPTGSAHRLHLLSHR